MVVLETMSKGELESEQPNQMQDATTIQRNWKTIVGVVALLLLVGGLGAILRFGSAEQSSGASLPRVQQAQTSVALRSTYAGPTPTVDCSAGLAWRVVGSPDLSSAAIGSGREADGGTGVAGGEEEGSRGSTLVDVSGTGANDVWAVGYSYSEQGVETLAEHWDGKAWTVVPSQGVESRNSQFSSVAAVAPDYVWGVGAYLLLNHQTVPFVQRWDGSQWSVVATAPVSATFGIFNSVAALSENDAWAVGYYADERGTYRTLAQRWDGKEWRLVPTPNVGTTLNMLTGVAVRSTDDVWAVGYRVSEKSTYLPLTMHWNGTNWSLVEAPAPGKIANYLYDVSVAGADDAWAVGYQFDGSGPVTPFVLRWDGKVWRQFEGPTVDSNYIVLNSISATADNDVWVAGTYRLPDRSHRSLVSRWDGRAWSEVSSPGNGKGTNNLKAITALNSTSAWAVGYHDIRSRISSTLVTQYGEPCAGR